MHSILRILTEGLGPDMRDRVVKHADTLIAGLKFLKQREDHKLAEVVKSGWSMERLECICCLSAFLQTVLGPLAASGRFGSSSELVVRHGSSDRFDATTARTFHKAYEGFCQAAAELKVARNWLEASRAEDLIYRMRRSEPDDE